MVRNIIEGSGSAYSSVATGIETVNKGIKTAAAQPGGISEVRDSFEIAAQKSSAPVNLALASPAGHIDPPSVYAKNFASNGSEMSALASNDQLLKSLSNENLDLFKQTGELCKSVQLGLEQSAVGGSSKREDLEKKVDEQQKKLKEMQEELENTKNSWNEIVGWFFGSDSGAGSLENSMIQTSLSDYSNSQQMSSSMTKKGQDAYNEIIKNAKG